MDKSTGDRHRMSRTSDNIYKAFVQINFRFSLPFLSQSNMTCGYISYNRKVVTKHHELNTPVVRASRG